jgi:Mitochondrial genome maintenance MGM101
MASPRAFIRAITQSTRAQRSHANRCSPSTQNSNRVCTTKRTLESLRASYNAASHRCIFTSSRVDQAQPAAVPRANSASSSPSTTPAKPTTSPQAGSADLKAGLSDQPAKQLDDSSSPIDWTTSFHGLSNAPFAKEAADVLLKPLNPNDVEIKPDGIIYLPEIKYRRILNQAFGPGGWGLAPRGESTVTAKTVTREYALLAHGRYVVSIFPLNSTTNDWLRLVSIARGEQDYFSPDGIPTAAEGCKSNAMMRCCKDLGVASELWDPRFIRKFKVEHARDVWVEHVVSKKKSRIWTRKGDDVSYPFKESKGFGT